MMSETTRNVQPVISDLGKPGSGELVPSRYAVRVGDVDVVLISDGILPLPTSTMSTNVSEADRNAWFDGRFLQRDMFDWALNIALVRSGERLILIDSGVGDGFEYFTRAGKSVMRLESAGIDLSALTDIVITHMHMDHVGGLNVDGVKAKLRPDVRIHVSAAEVAFWKNPDFSKTVMPETVPPALRKAAEFVTLYGEHIVQFDQTVEVAAGVSARVTGGHTPGTASWTSHRTAKADVRGRCDLRSQLRSSRVANGFEHDPETAAAVRIALFNEAAETGALLAAAHVAFPSIGHIARNGDGFRFVPVLGLLITGHGSVFDDHDETAACRRHGAGKARRLSRRAVLHAAVNSHSYASPRTASHNHPPAATGYRPASRPARACRHAESRSGRRCAALRPDRA